MSPLQAERPKNVLPDAQATSEGAEESHVPTDAADIGDDAARAAWADAAREVLVETAQKYHAVITHKELAAEVMSRSHIHTGRPMHYWIGDVLGRVAATCAHRDEPID